MARGGTDSDSGPGIHLRSGFPLLWQQFVAMLKKNYLVAWRNRVSTLLQLLSSLFFIFLIFCIQEAIVSRFNSTTYYRDVRDPQANYYSTIPPCEEKYYIRTPCYDFLWSGNGSSNVAKIVKNIMKYNPGRVIPDSKVKSFNTPNDVDDWLFANPMVCPGALHFTETNKTYISYGIQTNSTVLNRRGIFEDPTFKYQIPLQIAAEREIARLVLGMEGDPSFSWSVGFKEFAHPAIQIFSAVGRVGPTFFLATAMFAFVFQISSLVTEKELKLRQALSIMGIYDTAYWLSWLTWESFLTIISSLLIVLFGMMFQFGFFLQNSFGVLFILFFLFQFNMLGLAFMLSTLISKSASATTVGFSIFIIGFLTQLVTQFGFPYSPTFGQGYKTVWSLFPPNLLSYGLKLLGDASATPDSPGISWKGRTICPYGNKDCSLTLDGIFKWLITTFFLWCVIAIYLDNIIPNANGVRKPILYFLQPSYWTGKGGNKAREGSICSCFASHPTLEDSTPTDDDVLEEEALVKQQVNEGVTDPSLAVQIQGLQKVYPGALKMVGCCNCQRTSTYHAVKGLWVNFPKDQLFCLLGPNGAGKTTVINCLTGITPITDGDASIYGHSVRSASGMSNIRKIIGVCPQFDVLWDSLSGQEHLSLFATIKGLPPASIKSVVERSLAEVKLADAATMRTGSYSGGMKRRLSVAIALIGDPKLVFLDEPTTGMDPITRRHVWDIIENAKKGRAIVLTTHSMEEADILSDRIAIMARGKLRCIGTSIRLKSRFGAGYVANVSFPSGASDHGEMVQNESRQEPVKRFFKNYLDVVPKEENRTFLTFVIPNAKEGLLTDFFANLQDKEKELGISDIQLGLTTLEEVFLNIAKKAEMENASAEGSLVTLTMASGASIEIPKGARFVAIPGSETTEYPRGVMVEVYWEQDDTGELCISGHSAPVQLPPFVQLIQPVNNILTHRRSGRRSTVGIVIDPNQIENGNYS